MPLNGQRRLRASPVLSRRIGFGMPTAPMPSTAALSYRRCRPLWGTAISSRAAICMRDRTARAACTVTLGCFFEVKRDASSVRSSVSECTSALHAGIHPVRIGCLWIHPWSRRVRLVPAIAQGRHFPPRPRCNSGEPEDTRTPANRCRSSRCCSHPENRRETVSTWITSASCNS